MAIKNEHLLPLNEVLRVDCPSPMQVNEIKTVKVRLRGGFSKSYQFSCPYNIPSEEAAVLLAISNFHTAYNHFPTERKSKPFSVETELGDSLQAKVFKVQLETHFQAANLNSYFAYFYEKNAYEPSTCLVFSFPQMNGDFAPIEQEYQKFEAFTGHRFFPSPCVFYKASRDDVPFAVLISEPAEHGFLELLAIQNFTTTHRAPFITEGNPLYLKNTLLEQEFIMIVFRLIDGFVALNELGFDVSTLPVTDIGVEESTLEPFLAKTTSLEAKKDEESENGFSTGKDVRMSTLDLSCKANCESRAVFFLGKLFVLISGKIQEYGQNYLNALQDINSARSDISDSQLKAFTKQYLSRQKSDWKTYTNPIKKLKSVQKVSTILRVSAKRGSEKNVSPMEFKTPKHTKELSPELNVLCLATYMLRESPQNRPSLQQAHAFIKVIYEDMLQATSGQS
ncbi:hypothetical protein D5018_10730 [Parashewanella curva]|uniref:Protein kinase domain-containing protein n=1 Tax=Parashewanella curva TaxID=2338552 RepID=A0A3L8PYY8_9GAMM|nr:hypothetical protein [Parashewanella curva]RLV59728.1 hypothetical protein D5018_10730 [Parashewanella curva]